jgi:hypothetical protein
MTRKAKIIKEELDTNSIVNGFIAFPEYTYLKYNIPGP